MEIQVLNLSGRNNLVTIGIQQNYFLKADNQQNYLILFDNGGPSA